MNKNKIFVIIVFTLFITGITGVSIGLKTKNQINEPSFKLELFSIDDNANQDAAIDNPQVVITYPEEGSILTIPYLEVLGYAYDSDGMDFMEWTYEWNSYYHYENETLETGISYGFRIAVANLYPGTHTVTVWFYDIYDNVGSDSVTVYYGGNNPPSTPDQPQGPAAGSIEVSYTFSTRSEDPEGDTIRYGWDWDGDNNIDEWTAYYASGETVQASHIWQDAGIYSVKVKAEDSRGSRSSFSSSLNVEITENNAPNKPITPMGSPRGRPGVSYSYSSFAFDPEDHRVYYIFDWDDGTDSGWIGPYESGDVASVSHIYDTKGSFQVKVKAKDDPNGDGDLSDGSESVWSDPLSITMPRQRSSNILDYLFSKFPFIKHFFSFLF
jgi:hypothetical protein